MHDPSELSYYSIQGQISDLGALGEMFDGLPSEVEKLCQVVQGLMIHAHWAERYGLKLSTEKAAEPELRHVSKQLQRIKEIDDSDISTTRPLEKRLVGTCRDYALLLTTMLREQSVPARARCGFGAYFDPGKYADHWVCEYWNEDRQSWILVDAQLDEFQQKELRLAFDPLDVPRDMFLTAGKAWQLCRSKKADPEKFGIFDMWGLWFIKGNLLRDLASLNKVELLPWDVWGLMETEESADTDEETKLMDQVAAVTSVENWSFEEVQSIYQQRDDLKVPSKIKSMSKKGPQTIELNREGSHKTP